MDEIRERARVDSAIDAVVVVAVVVAAVVGNVGIRKVLGLRLVSAPIIVMLWRERFRSGTEAAHGDSGRRGGVWRGDGRSWRSICLTAASSLFKG